MILWVVGYLCLVVGVAIGIVIAGLMAASKRGDEINERSVARWEAERRRTDLTVSTRPIGRR